MYINDTSKWDLIAGKLNDELDAEENTLFEKAQEEVAFRNEFAKSQKVHSGMKELGKLGTPDVNNSWKVVEGGLKSRKIEFYAKGFLKYAAILLVAFLAGNYFHSLTSNNNQEIQYTEMEVMYGQTGHLFLFDGTEVWLNSGTKFKYPNRFNQNERNVFIEGEAYFTVKPNKQLPFKVKTGKLEVEVLGTSFNISAYPGESNQTVVLVEGKVQLNNQEGKKIGEMLPGQIAVQKDGNAIIQVTNTDLYFYTSWKDGKVVFDGENLGEIAKKIERWYNVEIRFENESLKKFKFTGTILRNKPIDQTIMAMELLAPIRFKYSVNTSEKNVITITHKQRK